MVTCKIQDPANRRRRLPIILSVLSISVCARGFLLKAQSTHIPNFAPVNAHLYRGGAPALVGLQELAALGVKTDIDLREPEEGTEIEQKAAKQLGMQYIHIPFSPFSAPSNAQIQQVLALLNQSESQSIFVHCRRGKDRTGTVIACYRIQHDGWGNGRALAEAKQYGMSFAERGMHSYIIHFTPLPANTFPSPLH